MPTAAAPRGQIATLLLKDETNYATAATGNYQKTVVYEDSLADLAPLEDDPILGNTKQNNRDTTEPMPGLKQGVSGNIVVPLDLNHSWFWLKGAFGAPSSSGADTDYEHVFVSGTEVLPHRTLEAKRDAAIFLRRTGNLVSALSAELSRTGGYQRMTVGILGCAETKVTSTGGGTPPAMLARDPLPNTLPVLKLDDSAAGEIISVSWSYNNGATPQDYLNGPDGYPSGHDIDAPATFTGSIRARFRTAALYDKARAKTPVAMELLWQRSATRLLSIAAPFVVFDPVGLPVTGPGRIEQTLNFRAYQSDDDPMLTVTLKNALAASAYV